MTQPAKKTGFTIIELMLAMAFVGALLLTIALTSMQVMGIYARGLTIREVNQAGRTITEDIQRTIAASSPFSVVPKTGAINDPADSKYVTRSGGGRLCTGAHTYAWNYGRSRELADPSDTSRVSAHNRYTNGEVIRFVKVSDAGGRLCTDPTQQIEAGDARELLSSGDRNLAVQQLTVVEGTRHDASGQALYAITLVIGTNDQAQLDSSNTTCLPPSEGEGGENFCAINQFTIIARAGNRSGSL